VGILENEMNDVLTYEGYISGTLFHDQADIHTRARTRLLPEWQKRWNDSEMGLYCYSIVTRVSIEVWMASTVDERTFLVAMSRLAYNYWHSGSFTMDKCCSGRFLLVCHRV
jgi:hypothetical protein